ncbi:thioredoxin domain-containing protein [Streptacidiphilus sp. EB129]|uniref:thioredoxin domain-containing protein n=1 Tax=Streptacidiphilus sp. EB129 TaxID=3156262 RepID=UPI00351785CF
MSNQPYFTDAQNSARDRLAAERAAQQKRGARGRVALIALSFVLVIGGGVGVSIALAGNGTTSSGSAGSSGSGGGTGGRPGVNTGLTVPAHASGTDGTVIVYGKADAPNTLDVYEDFRCPVCSAMEKADGAAVRALADNGTYKIQYHMATFLDTNLNGSGSHAALAAAGAALNESPAMFEAFHTVLYANQPEETVDGFADVNTLLALAGKVPGLRTPAFDQAVTNGTYKAWAGKVTDAFNSSGVTATPTLLLNGKPLQVFGDNGPITPDQYTALVQQTIAGTAK